MKFPKSILILGIPIILVALLILDFYGIIWHNALLAAPFKTKGLDVSHHQGEIAWAEVAQSKKYSFVFIKATEGHDFTDDDFKKNWEGAKENGLLVGAYHFFSIRSSGQEQAELFKSIVPQEEYALPPVIDIEIDTTQDKEKTKHEIRQFITALHEHYRKPPILYVMYNTYDAYIKDDFHEYPIWIRDVYLYPRLGDRQWQLWQYNNRGHVPGINGYVDINVFKGSLEELQALTKPE